MKQDCYKRFFSLFFYVYYNFLQSRSQVCLIHPAPQDSEVEHFNREKEKTRFILKSVVITANHRYRSPRWNSFSSPAFLFPRLALGKADCSKKVVRHTAVLSRGETEYPVASFLVLARIQSPLGKRHRHIEFPRRTGGTQFSVIAPVDSFSPPEQGWDKCIRSVESTGLQQLVLKFSFGFR